MWHSEVEQKFTVQRSDVVSKRRNYSHKEERWRLDWCIDMRFMISLTSNLGYSLLLFIYFTFFHNFHFINMVINFIWIHYL